MEVCRRLYLDKVKRWVFQVNPLDIIALALTIAGTSGGAIGFFQSSRARTTIELQEGELKIALQRGDRAEKDLLVATTKADVLEKHVTQAPSIEKMMIQQSTQHGQSMKAFEGVTIKLGELTEVISKSLGVTDGKK